MRRKIVMGILAAGAIGGFTSGLVHLSRCGHHGRQRAAELCAGAALAVERGTDPAAATDTAHRWEERVVATCAEVARDRQPPREVG